MNNKFFLPTLIISLFLLTSCSATPKTPEEKTATSTAISIPTKTRITPQVTFQMPDDLQIKKPTYTPSMVIPTEDKDIRSFQHGIRFIPLPDGNYYLFWSSSGNPPTGEMPNGDWSHDIYYTIIDPASPTIEPVQFIAKPEAQEPVSAAISADQHIMLTMEDGWNADNTIAQRYGVYDWKLNPIKPYPNDVLDGGHSGHVAADGNTFVIFYSDEWVDGGGVDDLGTGDDVLAKVYSSEGALRYEINVAVSKETRDWWPLIAGSDQTVLLLWQRYIDDEETANLMVATLDTASGEFIKAPEILEESIEYYTYNCVYLPSISRFLVMGSYNSENGFAYLLDKNGNVVQRKTDFPPIVRESSPAVFTNQNTTLIAQPMEPSGIVLLSADANAITYRQTEQDNDIWQSAGTDGIFLDPTTIYFVNSSPNGIMERLYHID